MAPRLSLFGAPTLECGGETLMLPLERRTQLLVFLALKRSWVGRADLAALLWPGLSAKLAFTNLRKTLFRLQSLPWADGVEARGGTLRFEAETDVLVFEQALRERDVAAALAARRGELLAGFDDDDNEAWTGWLGFERERLRVAWREAALARLAAAIEPAEGIELAARLLEADPLDEAALRAQMACLARDGQVARARQAYRAFAARLAQDLGLAPSSELKALHDALGAGSPHPAAAVESTADDGFVGRTVELRQIRELLSHDDCRLLTLTGPGGVGKTRLARRAMRELASGFVDGAEFVALEDVASAAELGGRLAQELGLRAAGHQAPLERVIDFLRDRHVLVVLDNFEHLLSDVPILERMLRACPRLKLLVTSRVRLAHPDEWLLPVVGLPCPEEADRDHIESFDAARLFIQAARRVEPALLPATEAAAIVDICRHVEGLPLALELAAAWTRVLSCDAIAAELRQGTELLRATDGAHPPRQASIEVVFDQTWRLLGPIERDALSRLSVFCGGFTPQAARVVADASLPVLGALADKSLLRKDGGRLFMHPLVQQLAGRRLADAEVREATQRAHALYFLRLLAQLRRAVEGGDRDAMQWVDIECDNCRTALHWSITHEAADAAARSVATLLHFCDHRARLDEGLKILRDTLESQSDEGDPRLEALLLGASAHLEYRLDRYAEAEATAARALAATERVPDQEAQLQCFKVLGSCSLRLGRLDDAERFFRQALQHAPASVDPRNAAGMLDNLALVEKAMGRYDEARRLAMQSLAQHRRLGNVAGEALCLNNLGTLLFDRGEYGSAHAHFNEGLAICERHGLVGTRGLIYANLTELAMRTGDHAAAEAHAQRALDIAQAAGNRAVVAWLKLQFVRFALRRGDLAGARADLGNAIDIAVAIGRPALQLEGVACFAEVLAAQGEAEGANRVLAFVAGHPSTSPSERDRIREQLARAGASETDFLRSWPGIDLEGLLHRIEIEAAVAHAPLIAVLRMSLR